MPVAQTIYDASTMAPADHSMFVLTSVGAMAYTAAAIVAWLDYRRRRLGGRTDLTRLLAAVVISTMAAFSIGYVAFACLEDLHWKADYNNRRYEVLDGCVHNFDEIVQSSHDIGVDTFTLNGRPFRLSDSGWRLGYHVSHHHGSPIQENVHLRVLANGARLPKIDVLSAGCSRTAAR